MRWLSSELNISRNSVIFGMIASGVIVLTPVITTTIVLHFFLKTEIDTLKVYFDFLYDTSGVVLIVVASFALLTAIIQSRETVKTRKASVIIELEARWSSKELEDSRFGYQEMLKTIIDFENLPKDTKELLYRRLKDKQERKYRREVAAKFLIEIRDSADADKRRDYHVIMKMATYFEYIGFLVERRYLSIKDVDSLFGQSCIGYHDTIIDHISDVRELDRETTDYKTQTGTARIAFQNFTDLVKNLKATPKLRVWD